MNPTPSATRSREAYAEVEGAATFICGHPKSGTSLALSLLDSHPELVVYPTETRFFRKVLPATRGLPALERVARARKMILGLAEESAQAPDPGAAVAIERAFEARIASRGTAYAQILSAAVLAFGEASGQLGAPTRRWVEKTPYNERFASLIFDWWPEARCVHVVRDPRDNFASYRRKHTSWSPEAFARSWLRSTLHGLRNLRSYGAERYLILRYEDLVAETDEALLRLAAFLGIQADPALRKPTRAGKPWGGNSMFGGAFEGISRDPLGRYRESLSPDEIARMERLLYVELQELGYPLEGTVRPSWRWRRWAARLRWAAGDVRNRARSALRPRRDLAS